MENRKLTKSENNKMIAGCLGGIAEYLGWEPTLLRIVFVFFSIFSAAFPGMILYLILWIIMPPANS